MRERREVGKEIGRREFIETAAGGVMFIPAARVWGTAANSAVRVGLLGCGGRGTEDATNLVETGSARVVALADMFQDQLDVARAAFDKMQAAKGYAAVDGAQCFVGPKAYEQIAHSKDVDAIVVASPPYFHPQHLEAVVAGGEARLFGEAGGGGRAGGEEGGGDWEAGGREVEFGCGISDSRLSAVCGVGEADSWRGFGEYCLRGGALFVGVSGPAEVGEGFAYGAAAAELGV